MAELRTNWLSTLILLAGVCLSPGILGGTDNRPERLILYVNDDNARVRPVIEALEAALRKSGVTARHRIRLRHVVADVSNSSEIEAKIRQALELRPAAIIAPNSETAAIAKSMVRDASIIFGSHQDPIKLGLVDSLARPGGNITGFTYFVPIDQKRLELLRQLCPRAKRLGILIDRWWLDESGGRDVIIQAKATHGFESELFLAETLDEFKKVLSTAKARQMDAWYVPYTELPFKEPAGLVELFSSLRKPVIFPGTPFVELGGLVSYQQSLKLEESARLLAKMVGLILDGVPAGEIPIERPKSFELAINVETAKRLRLSVPVPFIKRADRVIVGGRSP